MSFFKNLFGGTFSSHFETAQKLYEDGRLGEAKLAFERALNKKKDASEKEIKQAEERVATCTLRLAQARLAEADEAAASGDFDGALQLLDDAKEISDSPEIAKGIKERLNSYEAEDSRRLVEDAEEVSEDELMTIIAGTWTDSQADEYAALPDTLKDALLAAHDGEFARSIEIIKEIIAMPDLQVKPRYLYLELGRAYLMTKAYTDAVEMFDTFLDAVEDEDALESRVQACDLKAAALMALERFDDAEEQLRLTTTLTPEDHRVFLKLGVYLRERESFDKAVLALEKARELMGQMHPDFTVIRELGFTYLAMKKNQEAKECLNGVIEHIASKGEHTQFDPQAAVALATLHEEDGDFMAAADLHRHLAVGYDTRNHFVYNAEAARLLKAAKADQSLVDRYITRAQELINNDEERIVLDKILNNNNE